VEGAAVDIVFAACKDPSPLVRLQALHVIEDNDALSLPVARGMALICEARRDQAPEVRRFAEEAVCLLPKLREVRKKRFGPRPLPKADPAFETADEGG
jgi:hypothetical protein